MSTPGHFTQRVWTFLRERFPIFPTQILISAQSGLGLVYLTSAVDQRVALPAIIGRALTMPLLLLLIRISDELKDFEADRLHFPDRPTARGLVRSEDLTHLAYIALALVAALTVVDRNNLWMWIFLGFTLIFIGLMRVWFFNERAIKPSLAKALITHNPVSIALALFQISILRTSPAEWPPQAWFYLFSSALYAFAWEVGRKIRRPADETAYVTYSKIWGPRRAAVIATVAMVLAFICLVMAGRPLAPLYAAIPGLLTLGAAAVSARFILNPNKNVFPQTLAEVGMLSGFIYVLISDFLA